MGESEYRPLALCKARVRTSSLTYMSPNSVYNTRFPQRPTAVSNQLVISQTAYYAHSSCCRQHMRSLATSGQQVTSRTSRTVGWLLDPYAITMPLWSSEDMHRFVVIIQLSVLDGQ